MAQLQCQAGRGEAEREYDYIGWCASSLIQTASLVVAMPRLFECPSVSRREFQQGLSQYVPAPSQSHFAHLSRCTRPCPGRLGRTSSIPISCGASRLCACHPVGGHASVAINSSKRTATIPHFTYSTTCRTTELGFAQICRGKVPRWLIQHEVLCLHVRHPQ